jgi:hypothetical protein
MPALVGISRHPTPVLIGLRILSPVWRLARQADMFT